MKKKLVHIVSMTALGVILLSGYIRVDAASRTVALNMVNQNNTTSSEMLASNLYPINFMIVAGDTSMGDINYSINRTDMWKTYTVIAYSGTCPPGATHASTGFTGGTYAPVTINADSYMSITISKGTIRNSSSSYYIGSGLISTPTEDVLAGSMSIESMDNAVREIVGQMDLSGYYEEMNALADEMRRNINEWDEQNTICTE